MELKPSLVGVMVGSEAAAQTAQGATVDTLGFADVLAIATIGSVYSTAASTAEVTIKIQEALQATGPFADITDGAINGSFKFTLNISGDTALTTPALFMNKLYEKLGSGGTGGVVRKRYLRAYASTIGTAASRYGFAISVALLLGRPMDTLYVQNPVLLATGNSEFSGGSAAPSYKV
jgi:hypothetical protein